MNQRQELESLTLKFEQKFEQTIEGITRISGLVRARYFISVIDSLDLDANPRSAKVSKVTAAIIDSIETTPDIFPLKTKGVLLGATDYERLDRGRVRVAFQKRTIEGILDGGHNTLAIGLRILEVAGVPEANRRKVKLWSDLRDLWEESRAEITVARERTSETYEGERDDRLDFLIPIELVVPANPNNAVDVDRFESSILEICEARNNNAELTEGAKGNKAGFFNDLRAFLPSDIAERIEWVPGTVRPVKITDLIALTWLPLGLLNPMPTEAGEKPISPPIPQNLYRNKGEAIEKFNALMGLDSVTHDRNGEAVLYNPQVRSALKVAATLPRIYDRIYRDFPGVYNSFDGKYGKIAAVNKMISSRGAHAKFTGQAVEKPSPEGFVWPLVHGVQALMAQNEAGEIVWTEEPNQFLDRNFDKIVFAYKDVMQAMDFDPNKIGKAPLAYSTVKNAFILAGAGR